MQTARGSARHPAANALRSTTPLVTIARGRNPSGRARIRASAAGTPVTSSTAPTTATAAPVEGDWMSSTRPVAATATHTAPGTSKRSFRPPVGAARQSTGSASSPATGSTRVHRQPPAASTAPPSTGPRQLSTDAAPVTRPKAPALVAPSQRALIKAIPRTGTAAAPTPCTTLPATSQPNEGAAAETSAPVAMSTTPATRGPRTPTMSAIRPCTAVSTARATAYPLITQVALAASTPSPAASWAAQRTRPTYRCPRARTASRSR